MISGLTIILLVIGAGILHHYSLIVLRRISVRVLPDTALRPITVFVGLAALHMIEIAIFAALLAFTTGEAAVAVTGSGFSGSVSDWLYLAGLLFTTLAFDLEGEIRLIAATGSLVGFMLLTWSATFLFAECQKVWNKE